MCFSITPSCAPQQWAPRLVFRHVHSYTDTTGSTNHYNGKLSFRCNVLKIVYVVIVSIVSCGVISTVRMPHRPVAQHHQHALSSSVPGLEKEYTEKLQLSAGSERAVVGDFNILDDATVNSFPHDTG